MSKIYRDVLDEKKQRVFQNLSFFKRYGYLAGGTALALQIRHRRSYDFDVFTNKQVSNSLRKKAADVFGKIDYYVDSSDQISFKTKDDIAITFVWYCYKTLYPPLVVTNAINLASIYDIVADKAHTIGRRAVWRDYVDLFILLYEKIVTLEQISQLAQKKFGGVFNEALFLQQLCYFKDVAEVPIDFLKESYTNSQIKSFLEKQVEEYLSRILPEKTLF